MGFFDFGKKNNQCPTCQCPFSVEKIEDLKKNKVIYKNDEMIRCHKLIEPLKSRMKKDYVMERHVMNENGDTKEIQFIGITTQEYNEGVIKARKRMDEAFALVEKMRINNAKKNKTSGGKKKKSIKK
jgi:hypothetical protein